MLTLAAGGGNSSTETPSELARPPADRNLPHIRGRETQKESTPAFLPRRQTGEVAAS